ncbi:hypothetical protein [Bremerella sp.]|uniref:hypothetical protein n=1 Tax=Bremerella sp. TaxID=2795602 RepID=UPI00391A7829
MTSNPTLKVCPECQSASYRTAIAEDTDGRTGVRDRVCNQCGTRYAPPARSRAAAWVLLLGLVVLLFNAAVLYDNFVSHILLFNTELSFDAIMSCAVGLVVGLGLIIYSGVMALGMWIGPPDA